ncbi:MAG: hypothetical protein ACQEQC_00345 [Elusimicrobiota bacterium]
MIKKILNKIVVSAAIKLGVVSFFIIAIMLFFLMNTPLEETRKELDGQLISIGTNLVEAYQTDTENAIIKKDDISLNEYMSQIMGFPRTRFAMVLDPDGYVKAHNDMQEWGEQYKDSETLEVLRDREFTIYRRQHDGEPLFELVQPLRSSYGEFIGVLRVGFSAEGITSTMESLKAQTRKMIVLWALIIAFVVGLASKQITLYGAPKIKYILNTIMAERWDEEEKKQSKIIDKKDEWGALARHCDYMAKRIEDEKEVYKDKAEQTSKNLKSFIHNIGKAFKSGAVLANSENKVVYINDTARHILSIDSASEVHGNHIASIFKSRKLVELFQKSLKSPNQLLTKKLDDPEVTVSCVGIHSEDGDLISVLVLLERRNEPRPDSA